MTRGGQARPGKVKDLHPETDHFWQRTFGHVHPAPAGVQKKGTGLVIVVFRGSHGAAIQAGAAPDTRNYIPNLRAAAIERVGAGVDDFISLRPNKASGDHCLHGLFGGWVYSLFTGKIELHSGIRPKEYQEAPKTQQTDQGNADKKWSGGKCVFGHSCSVNCRNQARLP